MSCVCTPRLEPAADAEPARVSAAGLGTRGATKRTLAGAAGTLMLFAVGACSSGPEQACTQIGGRNFVAVSVEPGIRATLGALRLELCQAERCEHITFPAASPSQHGMYIQEGVELDTDTYSVDLSSLGGDWDPDAKSSLEVRGMSAEGSTVVRRAETFVFDQDYPNGKDCDPSPYLSHRTRIGSQDRVD
jgi:hypothetical protein